jgi:hypothetical protein
MAYGTGSGKGVNQSCCNLVNYIWLKSRVSEKFQPHGEVNVTNKQ